MLLSKASEYAIRSALQLAVWRREGYVPVRELAEQTDIPHYFLSKLCHQMTQAGALRSYKGPNGGVALARPADQVTLLDIVAAIDGSASFEGCVLGLDPCDADEPCPVHDRWAKIKESIYDMLSGKSVQELADELAKGKTTLSASLVSKSEG